MMLDFETARLPPRVHYAMRGPWLFVVTPLGTNRFKAWTQRIGWEVGEHKYFRELSEAKGWLEAQAGQIEGEGR